MLHLIIAQQSSADGDGCNQQVLHFWPPETTIGIDVVQGRFSLTGCPPQAPAATLRPP